MPLILIFFFLLKGASPAKSPTPVTPLTPSLTVSFERQSVRQKDCVNVVLLMSNESDVELTNASLEVSAPSFFQWFDGRCEGNGQEAGQGFVVPATPALSLGSIAVRSPLKRAVHFHTGATIDVGEYNVLFRVPYEWKTQKQTARSFVSAEKTVKVNFLGNESVAGIPLALAGFIVPGLIFWLIIKAFGAAWSIDALSNQMIYSVMVSIGLVIIGTWLGYWDVSTGISIERLAKLGGAGAILGAVVGGVDLGIRKIRQCLKRKELARQIIMGESESSLLGKLLELPAANTLERPAISIKGEVEYAGALGAKTEVVGTGADKGRIIYSLIGSFSIDLAEAEEKQLKTRLVELKAAGKMRELMKLAKDNGLLHTVALLTKVEKKVAGSGEPFKQWYADEVLSYSTNQEGWDTPVLEIK